MLLTIISVFGTDHFTFETHKISNDTPIPRVGELFDGIEVVEVDYL